MSLDDSTEFLGVLYVVGSLTNQRGNDVCQMFGALVRDAADAADYVSSSHVT